jgi:hypothetical protein
MIQAKEILYLLESSFPVRLPSAYGGNRDVTISENPRSIKDALNDLRGDIRSLGSQWTSEKMLRFLVDFNTESTYVWVSYLAVHNEMLSKLNIQGTSSLLYGYWDIERRTTEISWAEDSITEHSNFLRYIKTFIRRFGDFRLDSIWVESSGSHPGVEYRDWESFMNHKIRVG